MGKRIIRATGKTLLGDFSSGQRIGDYVIDHELPSTGTGIVYAGHHVAVTERRVVLRIVPAAGLFDDVALRLDEIDHPGTPRIFDTGTLTDHRRWIAVEHIAGSTVADVIVHRTMSSMECLALLRDTCEVLARAHAKGIVHGNIRPEHIVVPDDRRTTICLTGWDGARLETSSTTPAPFVQGNEYAAPEQMRGEFDDARTDVYALGVIIHRALHGVLPHERPHPKTEKRPSLLETLVDQMLCARADLRPTSARIRAAVAYLCSASQIDRRESWIVPTVALNIDLIEEQTEICEADSLTTLKRS
jgi:serine/threonine protein kinase